MTTEQIDQLRRLRDQMRDDTGMSYLDPTDGAPMVGTGLCHDVCMEASTEDLQMAGGWFAHPDGYHYGHSWLVLADGTIVDPTADQWHLEDMDDVTVVATDDPLYARFIVGDPELEDGYWTECEYAPRDGFVPVEPPQDPTLRGVHARA